MSTGPSSIKGAIRIMTVDDHPLLRQGIATLIESEVDLELVAEASDGEEAIAQFRLHRPDVTLMDIQMPNVNGVEANQPNQERISRRQDSRVVDLCR